MPLRQTEVSTALLDRLSHKQARHIVLLEAIVKLVRLLLEKQAHSDNDAACGVDDAIYVLSDMMGIDDGGWTRGWTRHDLGTNEYLLNQRLFDVVDDSSERDQMIVYRSAIETSKYHLERLFDESGIGALLGDGK